MNPFMLTYDQLLAAKKEFAAVKQEAEMYEQLGVVYENPLPLLKAMAEIGLTLCDRYEHDALSRPNYPLNNG